MQHLDEGTIHSWLDGALSAEEAARVEAHVAECPQCAAAVAEARGFIAASSRILTALDNVPRGVVPAVTLVKWYNRASWRAAAAVLVVAVGSLVVVSNGGRSRFAAPTVAPAMSANPAASQVAGTQPQTMAASPGPTASKLEAPPTATPVGQHSAKASRASSIKPTAEADFSGKQVGSVARGNAVARKQARVENLDAAIGANAAAAPQAAGAVTATVQSNLSGRVSGVVVTDSTAPEPAPLRVVGHPRLIGATVTLYEVAPGDTVTFTEPSNVRLESVVVTGLSVPESKARRSVEKSAPTANRQRSDTVTVAAADSQSPRSLLRGAMSVSPTGQPPLRVEVVNGVTIISWPDATTGNMLKLSGRMSVNRLKEIKLRIERERAAEAAKKKP